MHQRVTVVILSVDLSNLSTLDLSDRLVLTLVSMSFLYLSCRAIMDSPGGEFNSYNSKRLATYDRCEVFQTRKNIAIAEDIRIAYI